LKGTFDIFGGLTKQEAVWLESVEGLENARKRMVDIADKKPGAYLIYSVSTDEILVTMNTDPTGKRE
jgi:hypothetical protein